MARIEITLTSNYVRNWGVWEGLRELLQNAVDGQTEGFPLSVRRTDGNTLIIENEGGSLPRESLLIGYTTKYGRSEMIGQYGEGFKLGILALVRAGASITIRNGAETWVPSIERSEKFNADVLTFNVTKANNDCGSLKIMVKDVCTTEVWESFQKKILFLNPSYNKIETDNGDILTDESMRGKVYVKGIYVATYDKVMYGYNLKQADLDRDRRMVDQYDLFNKIAHIWSDASRDDNNLPLLFNLMASTVEDLRYFKYNMSSEVEAKLVQWFKDEHGNDAYPVASFGQAQEIGHFGARGIVVPEHCAAALQREMGSFDQIKAKLSDTAYTMVSPCDLTDTERKNLDTAVAALTLVESLDMSTLNIVTFIDDSKRGLRSDGKILISRKELSSLVSTVEVLVHEFCHPHGPDGDKKFHDAVARTMAAIIAALA